MPQIDNIRRKYTHGHKQKQKKQKKHNNPVIALLSGLFPWSGDTVSDVARKIVFLISMGAITVCAVLIADHYLGEHEGSTQSGFHEVDLENNNTTLIQWNPPFESSTNADGTVINEDPIEVEMLERFVELFNKNNDTVGFLTIDPYIKYPVVQAQGDKPADYYLNHNFEGRRTSNGTIFACKFNTFTPTQRPDNTIIHGHNLLTRNNFEPLLNYLDRQRNNGFEFLKNNYMIKFDTLFEDGMYKIFSVFQTTINEREGEFFEYQRKRSFPTEDDFFEYVTEVLDRSRYHTPVDLRYGDELLTLSTCDFSISGEIRLVIVARRVRWDEVADMNPSTFVNLRETTSGSRSAGRNADGYMRFKMFESWYNRSNSGRGWAGREWDTTRVQGLCEWLERTGFTGAGR
jgi:sortase B